MNITIGSDHGAVALKDEVKMVLKEYEEIKVTDVGTFGTESVDYPDIAEKVCADVTSGKADLGIVLCGTGIGISIAANKVKGIRCAHCADCLEAEMTRRHNDANMMAIGAGFTGPKLAAAMVETFLSTAFEGGRHARRVALMDAIEG